MRRGRNGRYGVIAALVALVCAAALGGPGVLFGSLPGVAPGSGAGATADSSAGGASAGDTGPAAALSSAGDLDLAALPSYTGSPYIELEANVPAFTDADRHSSPFEEYAVLDALGRCGTAFALVGPETMPTAERGSIGSVKPSGWHTVRYDDLVEGRYLYNRCHLIGYQLAGENANERNLITGTRYLNVEGMLPFEDEVADYVRATGNHVLYRATPEFAGDELVARGVHLEAESVEDRGAGVRFNVFCYNVQPGVGIDYATGDSWRAGGAGAN